MVANDQHLETGESWKTWSIAPYHPNFILLRFLVVCISIWHMLGHDLWPF